METTRPAVLDRIPYRFAGLIAAVLLICFAIVQGLRFTSVLPVSNADEMLGSHLGHGSHLLRYIYFALPLTLLPLMGRGLISRVGSCPRRWIPLVAALSAYWWLFTPLFCLYGMSLLVLLAVADLLKERRDLIRPTAFHWTWLAFGSLLLIGMLWGSSDYAWQTGRVRIVLTAFPLITCLYRPTRAEVVRFLILTARLFMLYLAFNLVVYLFYTAALDKSVFSALTFDKYYLSTEQTPFICYRLLLLWAGSIQPTFAMWLMATVWLCHLWMWRKGNLGLSRCELSLYFSMMVGYSFLHQTRYGLLIVVVSGLLCLFYVFSFNYRFSFRQRVLWVSGFFAFILLVLGGMLYLRPSFWQDGIRMQIFEGWKTYYLDRWLLGWGTGGELSKLGVRHLHNDFLSTLFSYGLLGLLVLLVWIGSWACRVLRTRNVVLSALGLTTLALMCIDGPLYSPFGVNALCLLLLFYPHAPSIPVGEATTSCDHGADRGSRMLDR